MRRDRSCRGASPAVELRRYAGPADLPHVLALTDASWSADGVDHGLDLASVTLAHRRTSDFDPERDVVLAVAEGVPVGFGRLRHWHGADEEWTYLVTAHVAPSWRGLGVGTALLGRLQARAGELAAAGSGPAILEAYLFDGQRAAMALLEGCGYAAVPELEVQDMVRPDLLDLPSAPLPAGLELRPATPADRRRAWDLLEAGGADDLNSTPGTEDDFRRWAAQPIWDESLWRLAWAGDELVGMVLGFIRPAENARYGRRRGYTEYVNVARPWRRRGVARALLVETMKALAARGMTEAALDVYVHNPTGARQVYERLGYRRVRAVSTYRKPLSLPSA